MSSDENTSSDLRATRMEVSIDPAVEKSDSRSYEIDEEQMERVQKLLTEHGFQVAPDSYQHTLLTTAFVTNEENREGIAQVVETLKDWYTAESVNYNPKARPQQESTSDIFSSVAGVWVKEIE